VNRRGPLSMPRAEPVTALPTRQGSTRYEKLRFPVPTEVFRAWLSSQVNMKSEFMSISILAFVGRNCELNCMLKQELRL